MTSSWRWDSDDEFRKWVYPDFLNPVELVRHSYVLYSFAQCARDLYKDLAELDQKVGDLETLLKSNTAQQLPAEAIETALEIAMEVCYAGEHMLLFQKRLAQSNHAYGFKHAKDAIHREMHPRETSTPNDVKRLRELRQLVDDTRKLLAGFNELEQSDQGFLVQYMDLPDFLEQDFRMARDLFSVGFDEVGLLIAGRGLEGVLRRILTDRHISVGSRPASDAELHDVIETLERLRWQADRTRFLPRVAVQILHWLRTTRNVGAHAQTKGLGTLGEPRDLALVIAKSADQLWALHKSNRRKRLAVD
jgi:hypothetical protein